MSRSTEEAPIRIELPAPGQARCRCGALLCKVRAASYVEVKCRRCARMLLVALRPPKQG